MLYGIFTLQKALLYYRVGHVRPRGISSLITTAVSRTLVGGKAEGGLEKNQPIQVSLYFNT